MKKGTLWSIPVYYNPDFEGVVGRTILWDYILTIVLFYKLNIEQYNGEYPIKLIE
jgi:hypothetical protein